MAAPPHVPRKPGAARKKNRGRETRSSHTTRREPRSSSLSTPAATLWPSTTIGPRRDDDVVGAVEKNLLNADYTASGHQRSQPSGCPFKTPNSRGAIHRDRRPTYSTLGDVHELLPRAMAAGPFASSTAAVVRNAAQPHARLKTQFAPARPQICPWEQPIMPNFGARLGAPGQRLGLQSGR